MTIEAPGRAASWWKDPKVSRSRSSAAIIPRSRGARIACVLGRDRAVHAATSQVAHTTAGATTVTVEPTPITDREDLS